MKSNSYIELKHTDYGYEIFVVNDDGRKKLGKKNKMIMRKVLYDFPCERISKDTLIYSNYNLITLYYTKEKIKLSSPKVNRTKSRKIIPSVVLAAALILGASSFNIMGAHASVTDNSITSNGGFQLNEIVEEPTIEKINNIQIGDEQVDIEFIDPDTIFDVDIDSKEDNFVEEISNIEVISENESLDIETSSNMENVTEIDNFGIETASADDNLELLAYQENAPDVDKFNYEYEYPNDKEAFDNATQYMDVFKKYERIYGVDANLLCAIGAQESSGIHHESSINGGWATGLMGIEYIWDGGYIEVFNFEDNCYETLRVDYSRIGELDYNIKIGAAIFQSYFYGTLENKDRIDKCDWLAFSVQKYNMGPGNMDDVLNLGDNWIGNRDFIDAGDNRYFEHVLSRLDNGTVISVRLDDGSYYKTEVNNLSLEYSHTRT